jgi:UDP-glucose:(heptosyl)LPS alpha-1,3-glucosyltransferase
VTTQSFHFGFFLERYFPYGGQQRDMLRFARAVQEQGHRVTICTNEWDAPDPEGFEVELLDGRAKTNHATMVKLESAVACAREQGRFDCIFGFSRMAGLDVYFAADVCLKTHLQQSWKWRVRHLPRYRTYLQLEQHIFGPQSDTQILALTDERKTEIVDAYGTDPARISVLPPGINVAGLAAQAADGPGREAVREQLGLDTGGLLLLTVASSFKTKGVDRVIQMLQLLPEAIRQRCHYAVVGKDSPAVYARTLRNAGLTDRVHFLGGQDQMGPLYQAADVLVHPARNENTGTVLLEALCLGLPVITSAICGYRHYVTESRGGIVCSEPFSLAEWTTQLVSLLTDDSARAAMRTAGHTYAQDAPWDAMDAHVVNILTRRAAENTDKQTTL